MLTPQLLQAAGYKSHRDSDPYCGNVLWQKAVTKGSEKLYFINVRFFKFPFPNGSTHESTEVEARLYLPSGNKLVGETGLTLTVHTDPVASIEAIEAFYARAFVALDCVPDLHNND